MYSKKRRSENKKNTYNSQTVEDFIREFAANKPITNKDVYNRFPNLKEGNIRQTLKRLSDSGKIVRAKNGIYFKPRSNSVLQKPSLSPNLIIENRYLVKNNKITGYKSGLFFANQINLTTQVPNVETIVSNEVSDKKRKIFINKTSVIVNAPRVKVDENNYKLLQVMDLMNDFENLSEYSLEKSSSKIYAYLKDVKLDKLEIEACIEAYPMRAQINMYKSGVYHEIIKG